RFTPQMDEHSCGHFIQLTVGRFIIRFHGESLRQGAFSISSGALQYRFTYNFPFFILKCEQVRFSSKTKVAMIRTFFLLAVMMLGLTTLTEAQLRKDLVRPGDYTGAIFRTKPAGDGSWADRLN